MIKYTRSFNRQTISYGAGDDRTFAGNASVFDSSHRIYPEKDNYKGDLGFRLQKKRGQTEKSVSSERLQQRLPPRSERKYHRCRNSDRSKRSGAVFWCWITGIFGIATKYAESLIAVKYRVKQKTGECRAVRCMRWSAD